MTSLLAHVRFHGRSHRGAMRAERKSAAAESVRRPLSNVSLAGDEARLCEAILARTGMTLRDLRHAPLARRMYAVLRALHVRDAEQAIARIETSPDAQRRALSALLIGHTLPFRDESVFSTLRRLVVPRLDARPRVWSLGCSRGLELLSVALLFEQRGLVPSTMRGSDLRAIDPARDVHLARDFTAGIPPELAELIPLATPDCIRRQVQTIDWRHENVLEAKFDAGWDLILCRNLTIYLEVETAARLWSRIAGALKPGGVLVVGKAERQLMSGLQRIEPCIYERPRHPAAGGSDGA